MGIYDRDYYRDEDEPGAFGARLPQSMAVRLIIVNVVLFLVDLFFGGRGHSVTAALMLHSGDWSEPWKLWHLVSYAFAHNPFQVMHLVGNMYALWFFGRELEGVYGKWEFLRLYLAAAVFGGVVWLIRTASLGAPAQLLGASGAVTAFVVLFACRFPHRQILFMMFIPMPAWMLGLITVGLDLYSASGGRPGSNVAFDVHLAGAAFGYLYHQLGWNLGRFAFPMPSRLRFPAWFFRPSQWFSRWRRRHESELRVYHPELAPPVDDLDERADAILAKLHERGDSSLTDAERRVLEAYSRRVRERRR